MPGIAVRFVRNAHFGAAFRLVREAEEVALDAVPGDGQGGGAAEIALNATRSESCSAKASTTLPPQEPPVMVRSAGSRNASTTRERVSV